LALQPKSAGTLNNLAAVLAESGKKQDAIDALKQAIEMEPDFVYSYWQLVRLELQNGKPKDALEHAKAGCRHDGCRDASALDILSLAYAANSDFDQAIQTERQAESAASSEDVRQRIRLHLVLYEKKKNPRE
jgi:tetratricopeptide (TPR) repeat protein